MRILVSGATTTVAQLAPLRPHTIGHLLTPHNRNALDALLSTGLPIGVDNSCFHGYDAPAFERMLKRMFDLPIALKSRILWCAVPDVVANHRVTLRQFGQYASLIGWAGIPRAFVAQDGCEPVAGIPWSEIRCVFIGGSTRWKLGPVAARIIDAAKARGCWVHMGRVNSAKRIRYCAALGVDSFDGSGYSQFAQTYLPKVTRALAEGIAQEVFEGFLR